MLYSQFSSYTVFNFRCVGGLNEKHLTFCQVFGGCIFICQIDWVRSFHIKWQSFFPIQQFSAWLLEQFLFRNYDYDYYYWLTICEFSNQTILLDLPAPPCLMIKILIIAVLIFHYFFKWTYLKFDSYKQN